MRPIRLVLPLLTATALGACGILDNDPYITYEARGQVTRPGGAPVPLAEVQVRAVRTSCDGNVNLFAQRVLTAEGGQYRASFPDPAGEFEGCVVVRVLPPQGSGLRDTTVLRDGVTLSEAGQREIVVDVQLPQ